jgi:hypothetical protein
VVVAAAVEAVEAVWEVEVDGHLLLELVECSQEALGLLIGMEAILAEAVHQGWVPKQQLLQEQDYHQINKEPQQVPSVEED